MHVGVSVHCPHSIKRKRIPIHPAQVKEIVRRVCKEMDLLITFYSVVRHR